MRCKRLVEFAIRRSNRRARWLEGGFTFGEVRFEKVDLADLKALGMGVN
ncbi:MAG: hypothetical protein ACREV3_03020 [Gammaproteobacteria bacterium]